MTIKLDQISDAILNAPGGAILALSFIPGGTIDTTSTSFVDITGASDSFSVAVAGMYTVIFCTQCFLVSGSAESTNFRLVVDSGTGSEQIVGPDSAGTPFKTWWCNTGDTNVNEEIPLPSTTKSIYQQRTDYSAGNLQYWLLYVNKWSDGYIGGFPTGAAQIQPQYTPDTKLSMLTYNDAGSINIAAAPGWPSTTRLTFQDGKQRYSSGTLAWAFSNGVADLGLDTGTEASSTWYFMYAVPKTSDDNQFSVRASISPPSTGPTGYTKFVYLGAFRNNASSNIIRFIQTGAFSFRYQSAKFLYNEAGPAPETTPGTLIDCSTYVPATASVMWLFNNIAPPISASFEQWQCDWYPYTYVSGDTAYTFVQGATHGYENQLQMLVDVPMPSSTKSVYRCVWRVSGTAASLSWHSASITGWNDAYLMK